MRVERLQAKFDIELRYTFFPLHPETPKEGLTLERLFAGRGIDVRAAQQRIAQLMTDEGLPYGKRTMTYNSRLAQELGKWAETQPGGDRIHNALYQAYFVDNLNLAISENLLSIVEGLGMDVEEAENALKQRTFRDAVDADWQRVREIGVTSVPTFVVGNRGMVGAQPYEAMERFLIDSGVQQYPSV